MIFVTNKIAKRSYEDFFVCGFSRKLYLFGPRLFLFVPRIISVQPKIFWAHKDFPGAQRFFCSDIFMNIFLIRPNKILFVFFSRIFGFISRRKILFVQRFFC